MVDRILIGKENDEQVFRISKPSYDVNNIANPMIVSSDQDYISIHHVVRNPQWKYLQFSGDVRSYACYVEFPELPYIPYVVMYHSIGNNTHLPQRFPYASDADWQNGAIGFVVSNKAVWLTLGVRGTLTPVIDLVVYKNKLDTV